MPSPFVLKAELIFMENQPAGGTFFSSSRN